MDVVEETLLAGGVDPMRIHIERFTPAEPLAEPEPDGGVDGDRHGHPRHRHA